MQPATTLTLGQAARMTGLGKTTLARAIKAGRLSATRDDTGRYTIDGAELARVFPFPAPDATDHATDVLVQQATVAATSAALTAEVAALREMLTMMREQVADAREERDRWRGIAERLSLAPPQPTTAPAETPKPVSWWRMLPLF